MNPLIIAHRGVSKELPENTLASFQKAIDLKCDFFECDVQQTLDKVPVVIHDETLERTTDGGGRVSSLNYERIQELVPTLEETLKLATDKIGIIVELKDVEVEVVLPLLKSYRSKKPFLVGSFSPKLLKQLPQFEKVGIAEDRETIKLHLEAGVKILALEKDLFDPELIAKYKKMGLTLFAWTVDDPAKAKELAADGIDGIITNDPSKIKKVFMPALQAS